MENLDFTKVHKVLLVGSGGKTGYWYARLLLRNGVEVYAYDKNPNIVYADDLVSDRRFHRAGSAEFDDAAILDKVDSVTLSPGVSLNQNIFHRAHEKHIFIFSELEYGYALLAGRRWICVTGTDGKSTTVALVEHVLNACGKPAISCGNYGLSFSQIAYEQERFSRYEYLVAELSSYQLELCRNLQSDAGLYLNLAPDHLDRYPSLQEYGRVKFNVALTVKNGGFCVINKDLLPENSTYWKPAHPLEGLSDTVRVVPVDTTGLDSPSWQVTQSEILDKKDLAKIIDLEDLKIAGRHNYTNVLFTLETVAGFGCRDRSLIGQALRTFQSLPHRYERIEPGPEFKNEPGNIYINDSKATTTQAAGIAVVNSRSPLFLFMGGRSKGEDYNPIARIIKDKGACVFLFGENRTELGEVFSRHQVNVVAVEETLEKAFIAAVGYQTREKIASVTYLLSPASTSWDQYSSFEERGNHFKELVKTLKRN